MSNCKTIAICNQKGGVGKTTSVIIPVQAQYLPAKGMTQLVQTISRVKKRIKTESAIPISRTVKAVQWLRLRKHQNCD